MFLSIQRVCLVSSIVMVLFVSQLLADDDDESDSGPDLWDLTPAESPTEAGKVATADVYNIPSPMKKLKGAPRPRYPSIQGRAAAKGSSKMKDSGEKKGSGEIKDSGEKKETEKKKEENTGSMDNISLPIAFGMLILAKTIFTVVVVFLHFRGRSQVGPAP